MPPIARTLGLILIGINSVSTAARGVPPAAPGSLAPAYRTTEAPRWPQASPNRSVEPQRAFSTPPSTMNQVAPAAYHAPPSGVAQQGAAAGMTQPTQAPRTETVHAAGNKNTGRPLSPRGRGASLQLPPRKKPSDTEPNSRGLTMLLSTGGALALVLGLIFVLAWAVRRAAPRGSFVLPGEVGRGPRSSPLGRPPAGPFAPLWKQALARLGDPRRHGDVDRDHRPGGSGPHGGPLSPEPAGQRNRRVSKGLPAVRSRAARTVLVRCRRSGAARPTRREPPPIVGGPRWLSASPRSSA